MLVFQILDDKKQILEKKNLKRNSKMMILGIDDHGQKHEQNCLTCNKDDFEINSFVFNLEHQVSKNSGMKFSTKQCSNLQKQNEI